MISLPRKPGPHTDDLPPGQYAKSLKPSRQWGWAIVRCPECGRCSTLGRNHEVLSDGEVTPSFVCPFPPCTWHVLIRLLDWSEESANLNGGAGTEKRREKNLLAEAGTKDNG